MNKTYLGIGIVVLIAVIAVGAFVMMNKSSVQQTSQSDNTAPSLDTTSADSSASNADASSSSFVNDSTPTSDQTVPDYK